MDENILTIPSVIEGGYIHENKDVKVSSLKVKNEVQQLISVITSSSYIAKEKPSMPDYQAGVMYSGTYQVYSIDSMQTLYDAVINTLTPYQSIMLGVPKNGAYKGVITTIKHKNTADAIARAKEDIDWNPLGNGYLLIDIDAGDVIGFELETVDDVLSWLLSYDKRLAFVPLLIVPSSSQKYDTSDKSWHIYIACKGMNSATVANYAKSLQSISWISGHGNIKISKAGSLLVRQVFDMAVFSPERLVLESVFSRDASVVFNYIAPLIQEGEPLDLGEQLSVNIAKSDKLIEQAKRKALPQAMKVRAEAKAKRIEKLIAEGQEEYDAIESASLMYDEAKIASDVIITFSEAIDGSLEHTAGYIKVYPQLFTGCYCADPYSPEDGTSKAYILPSGDIYSHKHGGYVIELIPSNDLIADKVEKLNAPSSIQEKKDTLKQLKKLCSNSQLESEEIQALSRVLKEKGYIKSVTEFKTTKRSLYEIGVNGNPLNTDKNLDRLLQKYYFSIGYDMIAKEVSVTHSELNKNVDNVIDTSLSLISSYAERDSLPKGIAKEHLNALCLNRYDFNPMVSMVEEAMQQYDDKDYIAEFVDAIEVNSSYKYKYEILKRWAIMCVAAWYHDKDVLSNLDAKLKFENVWCLLGEQGLNKTKLLSELLNFEGYDKYFKEGVKLNPSDKDSVKQAVSYAIVELGELDATFRKSDIADLKAFFSGVVDELRLPYDRSSSRYKRRTGFTASVNEYYFLNDSTGNRRYWVMELLGIDFKKIDAINMKQFWGQITKLFHEGHKWWFDAHCEDDKPFLDEINKIHKRHMQTTSVDDYAQEIVSWVQSNSSLSKTQMSTSKLFKMFDVNNPTKMQINSLKALLKKAGLEPNTSGQYYVPDMTQQHISYPPTMISSY